MLDLGLALQGRGLLADGLLLGELSQPNRLLAHRLARADLAQLGGVGDLDHSVALRLGDADLTALLLQGHVHLGLLHRLGGGLAANRLDVTRFIGDVGDVDVDEHQADLLQLGLQRRLDAVQEFLAIAIDVLDAHRSDHLAELAEDDVARLLLDVVRVQAEQTDRRVLHGRQVGADGDGEDAGHIDADVLHRQGALERDLDLDRLQRQEGVVLHQGQDEAGAAVQTARPGRTPRVLAEDHHHAVARAALVALGQHKGHGGKRHDDERDERGPVMRGFGLIPRGLSEQDEATHG